MDDQRKGFRLSASGEGGKACQSRLAKGHLKAPGYLADGVELLTADDKKRAIAGIVGSRLGAAAGALVPGLEWLTIPGGAVVGGMTGHYGYDHGAEIGKILAARPLDDWAY